MNSEQRAILVRAAEIEAAKQNAIRAGEIRVVTALDRELARLWKRFAELDAAEIKTHFESAFNTAL